MPSFVKEFCFIKIFFLCVLQGSIEIMFNVLDASTNQPIVGARKLGKSVKGTERQVKSKT
jgi:hypothetical protein